MVILLTQCINIVLEIEKKSNEVNVEILQLQFQVN